MHEIADQHLLERILQNNADAAEHNREHFDEMGSCVFNFMSAPGAGKTSLLESAIPRLNETHSMTVIEGDMVGDLDAQRLRNVGANVIQISTGRSCHLDAQMIGRMLHHESLRKQDLIFIENVGNLVCPAEFPLGETKRVVLLSVTEGDDKPLKYPVIFRNCDAVIFTKCDLLPYVSFNLAKAQSAIANLNQEIRIFNLSVTNQHGVPNFIEWVENCFQEKRNLLAQRSGRQPNVH